MAKVSCVKTPYSTRQIAHSNNSKAEKEEKKEKTEKRVEDLTKKQNPIAPTKNKKKKKKISTKPSTTFNKPKFFKLLTN